MVLSPSIRRKKVLAAVSRGTSGRPLFLGGMGVTYILVGGGSTVWGNKIVEFSWVILRSNWGGRRKKHTRPPVESLKILPDRHIECVYIQ